MAIPAQLPKNTAWRTQVLVWHGLFLRECKTRFGVAKLGLFWALVQPLLFVMMLGLVMGPLLGRGTSGLPFPMFLLMGFIPLNLFKGTITQTMNGFAANQGLLVHQKVRPTDPLFVRIFFESMLTFMSFWLFVIVATFFFDAQPVLSNPLYIILSLFSVVLGGSGIGIWAAVAAHKFNVIQKIVPLFMMPLMYLSCVIIPLQTIPGKYHKYLLVNPLVHSIEGMRVTMYPHYKTSEELSLIYPFVAGLILFWFGMAYYRVNRGILYDLGG